MISQRVAEVRLAAMMLTRIPVGRLPAPAPTLAAASWAYPLIGIPIGLIVWSVFTAALALGMVPLVTALVTLLASALLTGALHHDGLADFADGMGGGRDAPHCLEIMRDSRIGSYGVVALVLVIGMMAASLSELASRASPWHFLLVAIGSRLIMTAAAVRLPPARNDGLGQSSAPTSSRVLLVGTGLSLAICLIGGAAFLITLLLMAGTGGLLARVASRRIGGQTGDVLGAIQLTSATVGWVALSAM